MIMKAIKKFNIDLKNSFMIGDKITDQIAAKRSKIKFFFKRKNLLEEVKLAIRYSKKKNYY